MHPGFSGAHEIHLRDWEGCSCKNNVEERNPSSAAIGTQCLQVPLPNALERLVLIFTDHMLGARPIQQISFLVTN